VIRDVSTADEECVGAARPSCELHHKHGWQFRTAITDPARQTQANCSESKQLSVYGERREQ